MPRNDVWGGAEAILVGGALLHELAKDENHCRQRPGTVLAQLLTVEAPAATVEVEVGRGAIGIERDTQIVDRPRLPDALEPNSLRLAHEPSLRRSDRCPH